jgi:hypothetical protein
MDYEDLQRHRIGYDDVYELKPIRSDDLGQREFQGKPMSTQAILELQNSCESIIYGRML